MHWAKGKGKDQTIFFLGGVHETKCLECMVERGV